jgi:hypothetical protein
VNYYGSILGEIGGYLPEQRLPNGAYSDEKYSIVVKRSQKGSWDPGAWSEEKM